MPKYLLTLLVALANAAQVAAAVEAAPPQPAPAGHAHNDYEHARPLLDALDHGFSSVEADIYLVDGKLLVAHDRADVRPERTLEALYLDPLQARVRTNGGRVRRDGPAFTLLVDLKSSGAETYAELAKVLARYEDMLTVVRDGKVKQGAVAVVISGDRPKEQVAADPVRYVGIDGRMSDLDSDAPAHLMPMVSDAWYAHFRWRGVGPMPDAEREKLRGLVAKAHAKGRVVRFWAAPDRGEAWREQRAAGVDLINTDDLAGLEKFLAEP